MSNDCNLLIQYKRKTYKAERMSRPTNTHNIDNHKQVNGILLYAVEMIRCRNWFCARNNNNDYAAVSALNDSSSVVTTVPPAQNRSTPETVQQQTQQQQKNQHMQQQQQKTPSMPANSNSNSNPTANANGGAHVVTFLDDMPSGSNGVVNTTSRLVTMAEMHGRSSDVSNVTDTAEDYGSSSNQAQGAIFDDSLPPPKNCYRLVMLGSSRVGKSSIVARFLGNNFKESYTPTIEEFHRKLYRIRNEVYQLDLVDTSGYHPFPAMRRLSFLTGDIFILVFSMDSRESFEEVVRLRENILETKWAALNPGSGMKKKSLPKIPMVLAGNKSDREIKTVHLDEVMGYIAGQDSCCVFVECSARQNLHIDDLFYALFMVANMPLEMAPNHHRRVVSVFGAPSPLPPHSSSGASKKNALSIKRRFSDACGVVTPNARRPSIRTDLNLMHSKTMAMNEGDGSRTSRRKFCAIM